jgi:hypothetical protein
MLIKDADTNSAGFGQTTIVMRVYLLDIAKIETQTEGILK